MQKVLITYLRYDKAKDQKNGIDAYDKVYIITPESEDEKRMKSICKNIIVKKIKAEKYLYEAIDEILEKEKGNIIIPMFFEDSKSKYNIYITNKTLNKNIDPKIFRQKNLMNEFLKDIIDKKNYLLKNEKEINYNFIKNKVGDSFVIKPIDAASSVSSFRIKNEEDFKNFKKSYKKTYTHIAEEYVTGDLKSVDFYFNGEDIFVFCFAKETCFNEGLEQNKFSKQFLDLYGEYIQKYFLNHIPIRYNLDNFSFTKTEIEFLQKIKSKLKSIGYKGGIHLEYKYDKKKDKVGFIEWGARYGGRRDLIVDRVYGQGINKLMLDINLEDYSKFKKKDSLYILNTKSGNNMIIMRQLFPKRINAIKILNRKEKTATQSYKEFLVNLLKEKFGLDSLEKVIFYIKYNEAGYFLDTYKAERTYLMYGLLLNDSDFKKIIDNEYKFIELLTFSDYGYGEDIFKK